MKNTGWLVKAAEDFNIGDRVKILEGTVVGLIDEGEKESLKKDTQGVITDIEPNPMYPAVPVILVSVKTDEDVNLEVHDSDLEKLPKEKENESVQSSIKTNAQDIPTEQEQEVQQDTWEIGTIKTWTPAQLSVIAQKPLEEVSLLEGKVFKWKGGVFEVGKIEADEVGIKRIASEMTDDLPLSGDRTINNPQEDVFQSPYSNYPGHQIDHVLTKPKTGPLDLRIQFPGRMKGTEVVEKVDVLGPELKSPHPPIIRSPQFNEPVDTGRRLSSMPSSQAIELTIQKLFAHLVTPVIVDRQQLNIAASLEANYADFENTVVEKFHGLYPELVDRLLNGYSEVKNHYARTFGIA